MEPNHVKKPDLVRMTSERPVNRRRVVVGSAAATVAAALGHGPSILAAQDEATPAGSPTSGGRIVIGLIQEPGQLNGFFSGQSGSFISVLAVERLFVANLDGEYEPVLAAEVPTLENGGISEDNLTVTYRLKEGILWSDGEPFTADDIVFTWEVYSDPGSTPNIGSAYELVESVTAIDDLTVEVTMSGINPAYLELWEQVQPRHMFDTTAVTQEHPLARIPLGTGPFVITDWQTGSQITLERNPNYREEGKPYLDGITIQVTPEKDAAIASYIAGDLDFLYFIVTGDLPVLTDAQDNGEGVEVWVADGGTSVEWLWLNNGFEGDPNTPHPVLGDLAIRTAMDHGIDRQVIIDEVLGGFGTLEGALIFSGWARVAMEPAVYDPEMARQILEDAGWVEGDDGVREKDGVRASVRFQTISGDSTRELYQQVIQQNLGEIGIELNIENVPSNTIFGTYQEGGILARGQYDILMSRDGYDIDPFSWVNLFTTELIPSEENPTGFTYTFYSNPEFDALAQEGISTLDPEVRGEVYDQIVDLFAQDRPAIPLYRSAKAESWRERLAGVDPDFFLDRGALFSAADWYLIEQ